MTRPIRYQALLRHAARLCGRRAPASAQKQTSAPRPFRKHSVKVLVAEDHSTNRLVIRCQLERLGVSAEIVSDGRQALQHLSAGGYDLLITDVHMPELDGVSLTREIRRLEEASGAPRLPIVGLTADVLPATFQRCKASGMDSVLRKPTTLEELNHELMRQLGDIIQAGSPGYPRAAAAQQGRPARG